MAESPADISSVADSVFGNKESITSVSFGLPQITANPTQPDLDSSGKILSQQAIDGDATVTSLSIRLSAKMSQSTMKTLWVNSTQAGSFVIQVLLDESEVVSGAAVWRNMTQASSPINVVSGVLTRVDIPSLLQQLRIVYKNGASPAVVDAWVFSAA